MSTLIKGTSFLKKEKRKKMKKKLEQAFIAF